MRLIIIIKELLKKKIIIFLVKSSVVFNKDLVNYFVKIIIIY